MFFSKLFKDRKGNIENVSAGIFSIAVVLNVVCLATSLILLLGCFFVETKNIDKLMVAAIIIMAGCYVVEVYLAWSSTIINKNLDKKITNKKETK